MRRSPPSPRVTRALDDFIDFHDKPKRMRIDNGLEHTSLYVQLCVNEQEIELQFIQPGKPTQNSYIERLNSTYHTDVLDAFVHELICDTLPNRSVSVLQRQYKLTRCSKLFN